MSKVIIAFASFMVGACSMLAVASLTHTSTWAHADLSQTPLLIEGAEPKVPPLSVDMIGGSLVGEVQALDGLSCVRCLIKADLITYGGGAFRCEDCTISSSSRSVRLKGAALNTFNALVFFGAIPRPVAPLKKDQLQKATITSEQLQTPRKVNWVSLEGLK